MSKVVDRNAAAAHENSAASASRPRSCCEAAGAGHDGTIAEALGRRHLGADTRFLNLDRACRGTTS